MGDAQALTGADGMASVTAPEVPSTLGLTAERAGLVRSFPVKVIAR
jgi:hypothetical protein